MDKPNDDILSIVFRMSEEGSFDEGPEGLLPEADVMNLMRRMQDMNLPVSAEETQVRPLCQVLAQEPNTTLVETCSFRNLVPEELGSVSYLVLIKASLLNCF